MKKIYLLALAVLLLVPVARAQTLTPWYGVKAGVNFSNLVNPDYRSDFLTGYTVGALYAVPLGRTIPIYMEGSVNLQRRGARDDGFLVESGGESRLDITSLQIPIVAGCNIVANDEWTMQPFVGLYYSVALSGSVDIGSSSFDPFEISPLRRLGSSAVEQVQLLHRSDFGVRVGLSALWQRLIFGFSYDVSLMNVYTREFRDSGFLARQCVFALNMGYLF